MKKQGMLVLAGLVAGFQALASPSIADGVYKSGCISESFAYHQSSVRMLEISGDKVRSLSRFYSDSRCRLLVRVRLSEGKFSQSADSFQNESSVIAREKIDSDALKAKAGHIEEVGVDQISPELQQEAKGITDVHYYKSLSESIDLKWKTSVTVDGATGGLNVESRHLLKPVR